MIHKIICIHKIVISKRCIMNFTHFADARNFLLKLGRRAQFSLQKKMQITAAAIVQFR